ncbi:MAG: FHA domain-containing protein [Bacteroidales bacterium]|nr:FHA domain-containing protein [Bacteroidales bacterium]
MAIDVIIGRESGAAAPRLCIKSGDKSAFLGAPGSVPKSVSRSHCRLQIDGEKMTISNVSDQNCLFVNGLEYKTKAITKNDLVELGAERYRLDMVAVLALLIKAPSAGRAPEQPQTYNISHLKHIWDDYSDRKVKMQQEERTFGTIRSVTGILTPIGLLCAILPNLANLRYFFVALTVILGIVFLYIQLGRSKEIPLLQKKMEEDFQDVYVCPHCKHFLGNQSYKLVLRNGGCPWCKSKFTE